MAKKIALTGGIGSGKSIALDYAKSLGYKTISCDKISREIYRDDNLKAEIKKEFGDAVFSSDGKVVRKRLAKAVFGDSQKVAKLNALTHPVIVNKMIGQMNSSKRDCVVEVPLLFESGIEKLFDQVIVVMRDECDRVKAVSMRDGITANEVQKRIKNQYNYAKIDKNAHTLIYNDGTVEEFKVKVKDALGGKKDN